MATLVTVRDVPLLEAGVEYELSTGLTTFTPEDLRDVVTAANEDPSIPTPRAGIGHTDPRYNDVAKYDGTPAFGKYVNLRLNENGMVVYADWVGCPAWLAEIGPSAYPSRSIEGHWNVQSQAGKSWRFVLTATKCLGVVWPGVNQLEDLPLYYGEELPPGVIVNAEAVAASNQPGGDPMAVSASANLDDIRRAFYNDYVAANAESRYWWVRAVLTDPNQLVIEDDESGQLFLLPFTSDTQGNVGFGSAEPVRIDYVPDNRESQKAAASHVAATLAVGRKVLASWPTRAASRPDNTGGAMDPKEVRQALGLPEDASDEQVHAALLQRAGIAPAGEGQHPAEPAAPAATPQGDPAAPQPTPPPAPAPTTPQPTPAPSPAPTPQPPPQETPQQIAASHGNTPPGTVLVDEATWAQVQAGLGRVNTLVEQQDRQEREGLVSAAISDGRIPPARRDHWLQYLTSDPEGGKQVLASLTPNIIPMEERGHARTAEEGSGQQLDGELVGSWSESLFPEVRAARARDRAAAAGQPVPRQRIQADASYRR